MKSQLLAFLSVAIVASHAVSLGAGDMKSYWKFELPNTAMPQAIKDSLPHTSGVKGGADLLNYRFSIWYNHAATEDQIHNPIVGALMFKPTALLKGNTMTLHFVKTANGAVFLPRSEAEKIPFSSRKMSQILNRFSIAPDSKEAQVMKRTIKECEEAGFKGEDKQCATSLDSMVDFSKSKLGNKVRAISIDAGGEISEQNYTISAVQKIQNNDKAVVCHKQNYVYAVFYCHNTYNTEAYTVSLVGANGAKVKAPAVCHKDTSAWNPKHLAFQVLKVKPGTVAVCHFLPEDHIVWVAHN